MRSVGKEARVSKAIWWVDGHIARAYRWRDVVLELRARIYRRKYLVYVCLELDISIPAHSRCC